MNIRIVETDNVKIAIVESDELVITDGQSALDLATIKLYMGERNVVQILGNAAALFPLPILLRLNFTKMNFRKTAAISAIVTVLIEPLKLLELAGGRQ
jgi:hypothetical protein